MKVPRCKGMRDLLPDEMVKFRRVEEAFRQCTSRWGYDEVRTPTLEYLHLFTATGTLTPGMLGRVYSFLDWDGWSGERVVLRPEGTIPIARLFSESLAGGELSRLSYVGNVFTFEGTGKERREQWQCGVELIGASQPLADVELVLLAAEVLKTLGLPIKVKLSHAGVIKALIGELGVGAAEQTHIFDQVLEGNIKALEEIETDDADLKKALNLLLNIKGCSPGFVENIRAILGKALPRFEPSLRDLSSIAGLLDAMDCPYHIDIASGRGFEYYTGVMFQFYISKERVGGGGRYDDLISLVGGPPVPASGFALLVDRLIDVIKLKERPAPRIAIRPEGDEAAGVKPCFEVARSLREAGYHVALDHGGAGDCRWLLTVSGKDAFRLTDRASGTECELCSEAEIRKAVEGST